MVDYRNCTDDMFNRAMAMKNKDVDKIPTNYLYILYTKYKAERICWSMFHRNRNKFYEEIKETSG